MSKTLLVVTGLMYLYVAVEQGLKGNWPAAVMYLSYAFANGGAMFLVT